MNFLEKKALVEHLKYDSKKKQFVVKTENIANFLYQQEHRSFWVKFFKKKSKGQEKETYIIRSQKLILQMINNWNFSFNSTEFNEASFEVENYTQTALKLKVFFNDNPSILSNIEKESDPRNLIKDKDSSEDIEESLAIKLYSGDDKKKKTKWNQLSNEEKRNWKLLVNIFDNNEVEKADHYFKVAKAFIEFTTYEGKSFSEKRPTPLDRKKAICLGKELDEKIHLEVEKEQHLFEFLQGKGVLDRDKKTYKFIQKNPFHLEDARENERPLVWNITSISDAKDIFYLSVDKNFNRAVKRFNRFNFENIITAIKIITDEEDGKEADAIKFIKKLDFTDKEDLSGLRLSSELENGEKMLNLPSNYLDILRIQIQDHLLKEAA